MESYHDPPNFIVFLGQQPIWMLFSLVPSVAQLATKSIYLSHPYLSFFLLFLLSFSKFDKEIKFLMFSSRPTPGLDDVFLFPG